MCSLKPFCCCCCCCCWMLLFLNKYYCWAPWTLAPSFCIAFYNTFLTWLQFSHEKTASRQIETFVVPPSLFDDLFFRKKCFSKNTLIFQFFSEIWRGIFHQNAPEPESSKRTGRDRGLKKRTVYFRRSAFRTAIVEKNWTRPSAQKCLFPSPGWLRPRSAA